MEEDDDPGLDLDCNLPDLDLDLNGEVGLLYDLWILLLLPTVRVFPSMLRRFSFAILDVNGSRRSRRCGCCCCTGTVVVVSIG